MRSLIMLLSIFLIVLYIVFFVGVLWVGWLLQRSAMFSALKKYEVWKNNKPSQQ